MEKNERSINFKKTKNKNKNKKLRYMQKVMDDAVETNKKIEN